ncbi:MAG TPA: hypothetical protein PKD64_01715 [Pirellulaceae bacterium]|nr:hypothetical protein [Pirellulaceae bacterium]HMO90887.1 hypothetical protein [Pirellulaceae bacterium]HMP68637.1 hypothetical protein [Pirellulaceae bacterium]
MSIRAVADNKFNRRNIYLVVFFAAVGCWATYDGLISYPKKLKIAEAYDELRDLSGPEKTKKWHEMTTEKNWSRDVPKSPAEVQGDIYFNYFLMAICFPLGLFFLGKFFRIRGSWLEFKDGQLSTSWGESLDFKQLEKIDKVKWNKKGIAKLFYKSSAGNQSMFVLDDFKYDRVPVGKILEVAETFVKPDQIISGKDVVEKSTEKPDEKPAA